MLIEEKVCLNRMGTENQNKKHPFHRFLLRKCACSPASYCPARFGYCALMARKLIGFDPEAQRALELLSRDSGKSLQELADEAFSDLMAKHHGPLPARWWRH